MLLRSDLAVQVLRPASVGEDRLGNPVVRSYESETVAGVLVTPADTAGLGPERPEGYTVDLLVHFPKSYTKSLRGCDIALPAPWPALVHVVGDPQPYMAGLTPGDWSRAASCVVADG